MADNLRVEVDAGEVLRALATLGDRIAPVIKREARVTAERIRDDARARLARQTHGTGRTADAITIEDMVGGYKVYVSPVGSRPENLPLWLEFGTRTMTERPFMFAAALLEEGPHLRRVAEALQDAMEGLG